MKLMWLVVSTSAVALAQEDVFIRRVPAPADAAPPTIAFYSRPDGEALKGAPYSADTITESTQTLADGNRIVRKNKSSFARDSQGRTRREMEVQALGPLGQTDEPLVSVLIDDPVAKVRYSLDPRSKTVTKMKTPGMFVLGPGGGAAPAMGGGGAAIGSAAIGGVISGVIGATPAPGPGIEQVILDNNVTSIATTGASGEIASKIEMSQIRLESKGRALRDFKTEQLGEKSFEGVIAKGYRTSMVIPAGSAGNERAIEVVTENWVSDQLKTPVYTRHFDPRFGETITKLTNVRLGEPSAHLFEVPAGYQEMATPGRRVIVREEL